MPVTATISIPAAGQVNIDDIAEKHGWTGEELILGQDGNPIPELDSEGNPVINQYNQVVYQKRSITSTQFVEKLLGKYLFPMYDVTCNALERDLGSKNYSGLQWASVFKNATTITVEVE